MDSSDRLSERFKDIGRFYSEEVCALPGVLEDISKEGCKIHYSLPVSVDMENDYEAKITFARSANESFVLLCHPQWIKEDGDDTDIGFKILPSTDFSRLAKYIEKLKEESSRDDLSDEISDSTCQII